MGRDPKNTRMPKEEKQYDERVVAVDRVARVVKGGRRFRFRALVVVGDGKGKIGVGTAKGADVTVAVAKATEVAKKSIVVVALNKETIPHEQQARVGGAKILLKPAAPGTGLIAGGVVRVVLEVAGIRNILSKSLGSSNKINTAYATVDALKAIQPHAKWHTSIMNATKPKSEAQDKASEAKPRSDTKVSTAGKETTPAVEAKEDKK